MEKRVLLIGNHPPPFGGVPAHLEDFAPYLASRGWTVHLAMIRPDYPRGQPAIEQRRGFTIHRLRKPQIAMSTATSWATLRAPYGDVDLLIRSPQKWLVNVGVAGILKKIVQREKIALVSVYKLLSGGLYGAWLKQELGIPFITTIFGEVYRHTDFYRSNIRQVRKIIVTADKMASCSAHCARSLSVLGLSAEVEPVIYGIDTSQFTPQIDGVALRARLGIAPERHVALYVARMVVEMGLSTLISATPQLLEHDPDAVVVIGGARGDLTPAAERLAAANPGRVLACPDIPAPDLPSYYAAADVVVVPSINQRACLGLAIAEGMSTGKPVVAARVGGHGEVLVENVTGVLVPPADPSALAAALGALLADSGLRVEMGARGRERAVNVLDKSLTNQRMEELFLEVLARVPSGWAAGRS